METAARNKSSLIVISVLLLLAVSLLVTAYGYRGGSGLFPRFTGWVFVGLALLELAFQLRVSLTRRDPVIEEKDVTAGGGTVSREIRGFLWIGLFLALLYLAGFMIAIPLYIFTFLRLSAGRRFWECTALAASAAVFVYILFIQLLGYRLYPGIFLGS